MAPLPPSAAVSTSALDCGSRCRSRCSPTAARSPAPPRTPVGHGGGRPRGDRQARRQDAGRAPPQARRAGAQIVRSVPDDVVVVTGRAKTRCLHPGRCREHERPRPVVAFSHPLGDELEPYAAAVTVVRLTRSPGEGPRRRDPVAGFLRSRLSSRCGPGSPSATCTALKAGGGGNPRWSRVASRIGVKVALGG